MENQNAKLLWSKSHSGLQISKYDDGSKMVRCRGLPGFRFLLEKGESIDGNEDLLSDLCEFLKIRARVKVEHEDAEHRADAKSELVKQMQEDRIDALLEFANVMNDSLTEILSDAIDNSTSIGPELDRYYAHIRAVIKFRHKWSGIGTAADTAGENTESVQAEESNVDPDVNLDKEPKREDADTGRIAWEAWHEALGIKIRPEEWDRKTDKNRAAWRAAAEAIRAISTDVKRARSSSG